MAAFLDNCDFNATSTGTFDFVLSTALAGRQTLALAGATNAKAYKYYARSADLSQWEIGEGAANTATSTIPRTTVLYNSSGTGTATGQSGAGTKISFTTVPLVAIIGIKEDLISVEEANSFTTAQKKQAQSNIFVAPTTQSLTTGTAATYTTPAGCLWIEVFMVGGGGGGGGASSTATIAGSDGTASTFNSINANPGKGATLASTVGIGGAGGAAGIGTATRRSRGGPGGGALTPGSIGEQSGNGGTSYFAGGALGVPSNASTAGNAGDTNTGAGGSGALNQAGASFQIGAGGGAGEFVYLLITSPAATYTYTIGASGAGGVSTNNGGAGGSGFIFVIEHYGA